MKVSLKDGSTYGVARQKRKSIAQSVTRLAEQAVMPLREGLKSGKRLLTGRCPSSLCTVPTLENEHSTV